MGNNSLGTKATRSSKGYAMLSILQTGIEEMLQVLLTTLPGIISTEWQG